MLNIIIMSSPRLVNRAFEQSSRHYVWIFIPWQRHCGLIWLLQNNALVNSFCSDYWTRFMFQSSSTHKLGTRMFSEKLQCWWCFHKAETDFLLEEVRHNLLHYLCRHIPTSSISITYFMPLHAQLLHDEYKSLSMSKRANWSLQLRTTHFVTKCNISFSSITYTYYMRPFSREPR